MGLVVSRFRTPDPLALLPVLRARTEARLGARVTLTIGPAVDHLVAGRRTILVTRRGGELELRLLASAWWRAETRRETARLREAMIAAGGAPVRGLRALRFRFPEPPSPDRVAEALGARLAHRGHPWAVLRAGLRTPSEIEIDDDTLELQAPVFILGSLYARSVEAAGELAERVPLGRPRA